MMRYFITFLAALCVGSWLGLQAGKDAARLPPGTQIILPHAGVRLAPPANGVVLPPAH
jgi:hypothetical protein